MRMSIIALRFTNPLPGANKSKRANSQPCHSRNGCGSPGRKEEPAREITNNFNSDQYYYSTSIPACAGSSSTPYHNTVHRQGYCPPDLSRRS